MTKQDEWPTRLLTDKTQFTIAIHLIPFDGVMMMEKVVRSNYENSDQIRDRKMTITFFPETSRIYFFF